MNGEYQRLEAEASEVQNQIDELVRCCGQMVAADFQKFEAKIAGLQQRLAGLRQAMGGRVVGCCRGRSRWAANSDAPAGLGRPARGSDVTDGQRHLLRRFGTDQTLRV